MNKQEFSEIISKVVNGKIDLNEYDNIKRQQIIRFARGLEEDIERFNSLINAYMFVWYFIMLFNQNRVFSLVCLICCLFGILIKKIFVLTPQNAINKIYKQIK